VCQQQLVVSVDIQNSNRGKHASPQQSAGGTPVSKRHARAEGHSKAVCRMQLRRRRALERHRKAAFCWQPLGRRLLKPSMRQVQRVLSQSGHLVGADDPDRQALLARHLQRLVHARERLVLALLLQVPCRRELFDLLNPAKHTLALPAEPR